VDDENFTGGSDQIKYQLNTQGYTGPYAVTAELLYHPVSYQFIGELMDTEHEAATQFLNLYQQADKMPEQIAMASLSTDEAPTTTSVPGEPPTILHEVVGREGFCLLCHGEQAAPQNRFPDSHIGRSVDICLSCHKIKPQVITTTPPTTTNTLPPITTFPPPTETWGEVAKDGQALFINNCSFCHGPKGQGGGEAPQNIGPNLRYFKTAQILLNFISRSAPMDSPGSLSARVYPQIMAFMLVEAGFVPEDLLFDMNDLSNVLIE
jgi:hypothetical protein